MARELKIEYKGKEIPLHESFYTTTSIAFFRGYLGGGVCRSLRAGIDDLATVVLSERNLKISDNMRKSKKTKLYVLWRIGYRRLKREHGADEVREKAAEIWKLTSQEKSDMEEEQRNVLSERFVNAFRDLMLGWRDYLTDQEWVIVAHVFEKAEQFRLISASENEISTFLDDITPVRLRIRKLTPREALRLMAVSESDIDKLMQGRVVDDGMKQMQNEHTSVKRVLSNSSLYKLAGNSIVVDCMVYMFENLIFPKREPVKRNLFGW